MTYIDPRPDTKLGRYRILVYNLMQEHERDGPSRLAVWSHGIVVHCITIYGGTSYGADSSRQRHDD
jgi:hypothetical protein